MGRFFNMDSPLFQFLSRLADLMLLNVVFILTCIPVVTIGAACTAMHYVTLKMVRNEESYIIRSYFKAFKENFRQATVIWLIVMAFGILLFLDFRIIGFMNKNAAASGAGSSAAANVMQVGVGMIALLALMTFQYLFGVLAKFYNTIRRTFLNAFLMAIRHLPQTVVMTIISVGAVLLTFLNGYTLAYGMLVWLMMGFALIAMANSWFLVRIFDKYIPEEAATTEEL